MHIVRIAATRKDKWLFSRLLFLEKLELLLKLRDDARVHWAGRFRPPLEVSLCIRVHHRRNSPSGWASAARLHHSPGLENLDYLRWSLLSAGNHIALSRWLISITKRELKPDTQLRACAWVFTL
jgi:hypothetical protein